MEIPFLKIIAEYRFKKRESRKFYVQFDTIYFDKLDKKEYKKYFVQFVCKIF